MPLPAFAIPAAAALIGGVSNYFSGKAAAEAEAKRTKAANDLLERSIVDDAELGKILRQQTRYFNASLQNTLNTTAIRSSGVANRGVVGAAASGQVVAAKESTLAQTESDVRQSNADVRARQAFNISSGSAVSDPVGDIATGVISGGIAGAQFQQTMGKLSELDNDPVTGLTDRTPLPEGSSGNTGGFQGGFDITRHLGIGDYPSPDASTGGQNRPLDRAAYGLDDFSGPGAKFNPFDVAYKPKFQIRR